MSAYAYINGAHDGLGAVRSDRMQGINFSDPDYVQELIDRFRSLVDTGWIEECLEEMAEADPLEPGDDMGEGRMLLEAIRDLPESVDALRAGEKPANLQALLQLGMTAHVISEAAELPGSEQFLTTIQSYAEARQFSQFFDAIWEAETAIFFRDSLGAHRVELEPGSHPDVWTSGSTGSSAGDLLPVECKRISRRDPKGTALDRFADDLFRRLRKLEKEKIPLKTIVWLHEDAEDVPVDKVVEDIDSIVEELRPQPWDTDWRTVGSSGGTYQVSVASVGEYGQLARRPVEIEDVPAKPTLRTSAQTKYLGEPQDPVRLRVILQVRSDVLPKPIGPFESNLDKAMKQITESTSNTESGIAAIRLRPPRGKGDLYEADRIVRRNLHNLDAGHVGLVALFWTESETREGPTLYDSGGQSRQEKIQAHHLKPYFVPNPYAENPISLYDSARDHFPDLPEAVFRSPDTGELLPIDAEFFESSVPTVPGSENLDSKTDEATLYLQIEEPYDLQPVGERPPFVEVGHRRFGFQFDNDGNVQVLEVIEGELASLATIDLHAWRGEDEFLFVLRWSESEWTVAARHPSRGQVITAQSRPVWGVYV